MATDLVRPIRRGPSQRDSIPLSHNLKLGGQCDRSIENSLYWQLDMSFGEDRSRTRKDHAAANLAVVRRMSLSLLKNETSEKVGIKNKRLVAAWDTGYLHKLLFGA